MTDTATADFDSFFAAGKAAAEESLAATLFAADCLPIVEHATKHADNLPGIAALVLLSIRQPFYMMPRQMADVARNGLESPYLFGWKRDGLAYVIRNRHALHRAACAYRDGTMNLDSLILEYLAVPGLGIVKASFLAQMTVGDGACLDTLNLRTLGLSETAFRLSKALTVATVRKRITTYNAVWRSVGDSAHWWDSWCAFVGDRTHNDRGAAIGGFRNAAHVSATHRLAITTKIKGV